MTSGVQADEIVAAARACLGTPFHHQGRQPGVGLDCAGLVIVACKAVGIPYQDFDGYNRRPHAGRLEEALSAQQSLVAVPRHEMRAGDLLLMRFKTEPQHLAIYACPTLIHSYEAVGRVVEHPMDDAWRGRIVAVYRFAGVGA